MGYRSEVAVVIACVCVDYDNLTAVINEEGVLA
jgi:hypothetical protein